MEDKSGKRLKEEKKQELQQKSQEELQREETFKTWLTGLHRRRKVCDRNTEVIYLNFYKVGKVTENALTQGSRLTFQLSSLVASERFDFTSQNTFSLARLFFA